MTLPIHLSSEVPTISEPSTAHDAAAVALLALWCGCVEMPTVAEPPRFSIGGANAPGADLPPEADPGTDLHASAATLAALPDPCWISSEPRDGTLEVRVAQTPPHPGPPEEWTPVDLARWRGRRGLDTTRALDVKDGDVVLACGGSVRLYVRAPALALLDARYRFDAPVTYIAGRADDTFHQSWLPSAELSRASLVLRFGRARDVGGRYPLHYPGGWTKEPG